MMARVNQDQSLFSASLDFAQALLKNAREHKERFIFIAADELFNSTEFYEGVTIASKFLLTLGHCPNCIACITTHFRALTEFEKNEPSMYKNYQASLTGEGSQVRTYALKPGTSDSNLVFRHIPIADLEFDDTDMSIDNISH